MNPMLKLLAGKRVLFYGPANTSVTCQVDPCAYDTVFITNHMLHLYPPSRCANKLALIVGSSYARRLGEDINASETRHLSAILTAQKDDAHGIAQKHHLDVLPMETPKGIAGQPLGLSFFLHTIENIRGTDLQDPFASLHITGVTFYDNGQQYTEGYGLLGMSWRHRPSANKDYALRWIHNTSHI